ncbi:hypothetical protein ACO0QE_004484 [Hanseniaspora vineae]
MESNPQTDSFQDATNAAPTPVTTTATQPPAEAQQQQQQQQQTPAPIDYNNEVDRIKNMAFAYLATQTQPIIVPSFAQWFDISKVHEIEKTYFPEFFNIEKTNIYKTPSVYQDCRDFMINTYRLQPSEYLTITGVRRNLALDVGSIVKIHQFLEKWGLINYQIQPRTKPSLVGPQFTGHFQIIMDTPSGLKPYLPVDSEVSNLEPAAPGQTETEANNANQPVHMNTTFKETIYNKASDFMNLDPGYMNNLKKYVCQSCGNDTATYVYHNLRDKNDHICMRCFQEGRFKTIYSSSDFIKLDSNNFSKVEEWSDSDLFRLLESLEMFGTNWDKIALHVGKSKEECIVKFIELPIEDEYINKVLQKATTTATSNDGIAGQSFTIEKAIDQLMKNLNNKDKQAIIDNSNRLSEKYLKESQNMIQDLCVSKISQIDSKLSKLSTLEKTITDLQKNLENDKLVLQQDKQALANDVQKLNAKLSALGINEVFELQSVKRASDLNKLKKVESTPGTTLVSGADSSASGEKSETTEEAAKQSEETLPSLDVNSISMEAPEVYTHWKL